MDIYEKLAKCETAGEVRRMLAGNGVKVVTEQPTERQMEVGYRAYGNTLYTSTGTGPESGWGNAAKAIWADMFRAAE